MIIVSVRTLSPLFPHVASHFSFRHPANLGNRKRNQRRPDVWHAERRKTDVRNKDPESTYRASNNHCMYGPLGFRTCIDYNSSKCAELYLLQNQISHGATCSNVSLYTTCKSHAISSIHLMCYQFEIGHSILPNITFAVVLHVIPSFVVYDDDCSPCQVLSGVVHTGASKASRIKVGLLLDRERSDSAQHEQGKNLSNCHVNRK